MPPAVYPLFYWGLFLVTVPVLIHLINMFRHQQVHWAAMEFLLASQKKYRTWVILKQLLLLLLRMAAIALVVLALAQPLLPERLGGFLGGRPTHHIVLLDDSYSMSDRRGEKSAFDRAKDAISRLGDSMLRPREPQSFTLLRLSRCGRYGGGLRADFQKERVDSGFPQRLAAALKDIQVSQTAAEPLPALEPEVLQQLLGPDAGDRRVIYLLSDFRARQWEKPDELKKRLLQIDAGHSETRLVDCAEDVESGGHPNLAIADLQPEEGIRAAGIRWRMKVTVRNYGPTTVRKVPFVWTADGKPAEEYIDEIPPGGSADKLFYVSFDAAGQHQIAAHLGADAVEADNNRFAVVDLPIETPVLLVDGATNGRPTNSRRLQDVMSPGGPVRSGIDARRIESPKYLALPTRPLGEFAMISVANVDRIDLAGVKALEEYVNEGGGVFFVAGPNTRGDFVTRSLYRNGDGLFPVPLTGPQPLPVSPLDNTPDVQSEDHPLFHGVPDRVGFISAIHVNQYYGIDPKWTAKEHPKVRVIMKLRNGAPLLLEESFGRGKVVALLTTTAATWNNWAIEGPGPSFVAFVENLVPYLSRRAAAGVSLQVGEPKTISFPAGQYEPIVRFDGPGGDASSASVEAKEADSEKDAGKDGGKDKNTKDAAMTATFDRTALGGFYTAKLTTRSNKIENRVFAVNVDPAEGDLKTLRESDFQMRLAPELKTKLEYASTFETQLDESRSRNLGDLLLLVLVLVLVLEQLLAWSCGYHLSAPARMPASGRAKGGLA